MSIYTHTLTGQEAEEAIENLPDLSLPSSQKQKATGTDNNKVDSDYKPAYKKLTKNAYFNKNELTSNVTIQGGNNGKISDCNINDKSLSNRKLGNSCQSLTTIERRGRDSNPR